MKLILQILFGSVLITMLTNCEKYSPIPKGSFESSGDFYTSGFNTEDFFEIEFYNPETNEIKGRFQVTMILTPNNYGHNAPDTLRFTKGEFHTRIVNPRLLYPR